MKLYQNYIFKKIAITFVAITSILVSLIWFTRIISFIGYITESGVEIKQFFVLLVLILPWLLLFIIPIALCVTVIVIYWRLISHNEIVILKNSGIANYALAKPAILIVIISTLFCLSISLYIMPYANKQLRVSKTVISNNYDSLAIAAKTFIYNIKNMVIYVQKRDGDNLSGIFIYDNRSKDNSAAITAKSAKAEVQNGSIILYLQNGTLQKYDRTNNKAEVLSFASYSFNLNERGSEDINKLVWSAKERYIHELLNPQDVTLNEDQQKRIRNEIHKRFIYPLFSFIFSFVGVAAMLGGAFNRRGNSLPVLIAGGIVSTFLITEMLLITLAESNTKLVTLPYLNPLLFMIISCYLITRNPMRTQRKIVKS